MAARRRKPKHKCRGPRKTDGRACQRGVSAPGERCSDHEGLPEVPPGGRLPQYVERSSKQTRSSGQKKTGQKASSRRSPSVSRAAAPRHESFALSEKTQEKLVAEAVEYFHATISSNVVDAAASRAGHYAGDAIWSELTRDWTGRNCKWLARLARFTLKGKDWLHSRDVTITQIAGKRPERRRVATYQ